MKILLIDNPSSFLDFALRCMAHGHQVKVWMGSDKKGARSTVGDGMIDKIADWRPAMKWADLIVTSDNVIHMRELEAYRKAGFPMFNAHAAVTEWELNRGTGQRVFEAAGIPTIESPVFTSYDKAIAFVEKTMKRYVSKPSGDADKALTYVSKGPRDMISMLERWKKLNKLKAPFILQEFKPGIEMAVSGWFGPNGFSKHFLENFEFKKLMNDDKGPATGEQGCYSADTEVLTDSGWKFWPDVTYDDKLATLIDGKTVFEAPSLLVEFDVNGEMIQWKNRSVDILVTPNHNMYVMGQHEARTNAKVWKFILAEDCTQSQYAVKRDADWDGESPDAFVCAGSIWHNGMGVRTTDDVVVPFDEWCKFLGIYFAEGSATTGTVNIAQSHPVKSEKVEALLSNFPVTAKRYENGFLIHSAAVARMVKGFGRSYEKRVPDYIKSAKKEHIKLFLDAFCLGDGHVQKNGSRLFYTSNPGLADDLQELMLKCGHVGVVKRLARKKTFGKINGRVIHQRRDAYVVYERTKKITGWLDARDRKVVQYEGKVYCATVSSHVLFVRRNGKPIWCGNTVMRYLPESKLADLVLKPLAPELFRQGYCGFIDVSVMIDEKGQPWPMEHTCTRFGWPLFQIQQELHPDPVGWMHDLLYGLDSFEPDMKIAAGVVVAIPDYPYSHLTKKEVSDFPIWGITDQNREHVHLAEVKLGMGVEEEGGKIVRKKMPVTAGDYAYIATGKANTVESATKAAYRVVDQIELPNSPILRTDIGNRLEKQLPKLQKNGFAMGWKYR